MASQSSSHLVCPSEEGSGLSRYCGQALRCARKAQGLSLEAVAARAHLTRARLAYFETGKRDLPLSALGRLTAELGLTVADLLPPEGPRLFAEVALLLHARGIAFTAQLKVLLEVLPDCMLPAPR